MTEILVYYGDDFAGWMAAGNPDHLPVVQCQTPAITQPPTVSAVGYCADRAASRRESGRRSL